MCNEALIVNIVCSLIIRCLREDWQFLQAGVSRSATTVLSYLMAREALSFEDALTDVMSKRICIAPNRGFCDQLRILQDQCGGDLESYKAEMLQVNKYICWNGVGNVCK